MKKIGIIGGLGPESTSEFYQHITRRYYEIRGDYAYPEIIIYSVSFERFIDCGYEAAVRIRDVIGKLEAAGADFVTAACNSIHIVHEAVSKNTPIPWISIMDAVAEEIQRRSITTVGLLGTVFTMSNDFYRKALARYGIETIVPDNSVQEDVNRIIFTELVRGITTAESKEFMLGCMDDLQKRGAGGIVLGCTELPFLIRQEDTAIPVFDSTLIYAYKALDYAMEE